MKSNILKKTRSEIMQAVHSKDTRPEMVVRKLIYAMGYRYRIHRKDIPGNPDIVFHGRKKVIFVHGCFWHGHDCTSGRNLPVTNLDYWIPKLRRNQERDKGNISLLKKKGWGVLVIWECQVKKRFFISKKIKQFLNS